MKFGIIDPIKRSAEIVDADTLQDAEAMVGLNPNGTDHGSVARGLGIVVYEFGLYEKGLGYFSIAGRLYTGGAVLYAYGDGGYTVDIEELPEIDWLRDEAAVELSISAGLIVRPRVAVGDTVYWQWPNPKPDLEKVVQENTKVLTQDGGGTVLIDGDTAVSTKKP